MKKWWSRVSLLVMSTVVFLAGCSSQTSDVSQKPTETKQAEQPKDSKTDFPKKNITLIVPFSPGGGYDSFARAFAQYAKPYLPEGIDFVVTNRPGGSGLAGTIELYRSRPDGYTIGIPEVSLIANQVALGEEKIGADLRKLTWLGQMAADPHIILVPAKSSFKTIEDLKGLPAVRFGMATVFAEDMIASELFGWKSNYVMGFDGSGEAVTAAARGEIDVHSGGASSMNKYVQSGDLRPIIQLSDEKSPLFPDVPTAKEKGIDLSFALLRCLAAPPGVSPEQTAILQDIVLKTVQDEGFQKWAKDNKMVLDPADGEKLSETVNKMYDTYSKYKSSFDTSFQNIFGK